MSGPDRRIGICLERDGCLWCSAPIARLCRDRGGCGGVAAASASRCAKGWLLSVMLTLRMGGRGPPRHPGAGRRAERTGDRPCGPQGGSAGYVTGWLPCAEILLSRTRPCKRRSCAKNCASGSVRGLLLLCDRPGHQSRAVRPGSGATGSARVSAPEPRRARPLRGSATGAPATFCDRRQAAARPRIKCSQCPRRFIWLSQGLRARAPCDWPPQRLWCDVPERGK